MNKPLILLAALALGGCARNPDFPSWAMIVGSLIVSMPAALKIRMVEPSAQWLGDSIPVWLVFFLALLLAACSPAQAAPLDMDLLRDVAVREQENNFGTGCPDGEDGEIGCWQVKLGTARQVGFTGARWELRLFNRAWASEILRRCARRHGWRAQPLTAIAQCYGGGLKAVVGKRGAKFGYAQQVSHRYYAALMEQRRELLARAR